MMKRPRLVLGVSLEDAILITDQQRLIERHKGNTKVQPNPPMVVQGQKSKLWSAYSGSPELF